MAVFHISGSFATVKKGIRKSDGAVFAVKFIDKTALKKDDEAMLVSVHKSVGVWPRKRGDLAAALRCVCMCVCFRSRSARS